METSTRPREDNEDEYFKDNVIFNIILLSLIAIFINVGNFLILAAFKKHHFVKNMDILIAFLALMDYIGSWVVLPIAIYTYAAPEVIEDNEVVERVLCKISGVGFLFIQLTSTFAITLMTLDRFVAVKKPFFYRSYCDKRPTHIKIILVILSVLVLGLSCGIVFLEDDSFYFRDGMCTFESNFSWGKLIVIIVGLSQIPLVVCCYTSFVLTVRKLDRKRNSYLKRLQQPKVPSNNGGCQLLLTQNRSGNRRVNSSSFQRAPLKCSPPIAKAVPPSKDLYVNRGSRLYGTVALVVAIYYVPWIFILLSMMTEMFTEDNYDVLHYVATRLIFMGSIFNPFIYARMTRYLTAFREIICSPFRYCGCYTKPYPDGMTANEVHRIVNRMAFEEWESPGLNRRIYSKRKMMKSSSGDRYEESFSELTRNSGMMTSNPHLPETFENTADVYEVARSPIFVEDHRESKTKQERRQSDSGIIDDKPTGTALHQKSLSDSCIHLLLCQENEDESFWNDYLCTLHSGGSTGVDFKSMNPGRIEIRINKKQETDNLPIDSFLVKSRHDFSISEGEKTKTNKATFHENKPTKMNESDDINEMCECSSSTELSNESSILHDELSINSTDNQSATCSKPECMQTQSGEGYHMSNVILECQNSQTRQPQKGNSDENQIKTTITKEKDNLTVLLRTRVENVIDSHKIKFQLEVLDPGGLIKLQGTEVDDDTTLPAFTDSSVPNFVFSLKENCFVVDESSRTCQKIKSLKINYTLKRLSGDDHFDSKGIVKLQEPVRRNEIEGDADVSDLEKTVPLNDIEYITPF